MVPIFISKHGFASAYPRSIYYTINPSFCNAHSVWLKPTNPSLFGFRFSTLCSSAHSKHQNWHRLRAWKKTKVTSGIVSCPGGGTQIWPHIQHDLSGKRWLVQIYSFWQSVLLWKDVQEFNHPKNSDLSSLMTCWIMLSQVHLLFSTQRSETPISFIVFLAEFLFHNVLPRFANGRCEIHFCIGFECHMKLKLCHVCGKLSFEQFWGWQDVGSIFLRVSNYFKSMNPLKVIRRHRHPGST